MAFSNEQLAYASGSPLNEFGFDFGLSRDGEGDADFRARIQRVAFPVADVLVSGETLRDKIAIETMKIVFSESLAMDFPDDSPFDRIAIISYQMADAMLAERAK
ncbi:hypothetical protein D3C76_260110 [compost metagenome]